MYATRLRTDILNKCACNSKLCSAVAFSILVQKYRVVWRRINRIAHYAGVSPATAKRYIDYLMSVKLVSIEIDDYGKEVYYFHKLYAPKTKLESGRWIWRRGQNVIISEMNAKMSSLTELSQSIRAIYIAKRQEKRNYVSRLVELATNPAPGVSADSIRKAQKKLIKTYGKIPDFRENGMSFAYLRKTLGCGTKTLITICSLASELGIFTREVPEAVRIEWIKKNTLTENWRDFAGEIGSGREETEKESAADYIGSFDTRGGAYCGSRCLCIQPCGRIVVGSNTSWFS